MKFVLTIVLLFFINHCSFDNKTGIWNSSEKVSRKENGIFKEFKNISIFEKNFNQIINLDKNYKILLEDTENNLQWSDIFFKSNNNLSNFAYNDQNELLFKSKKLSRKKINKNILYSNDNIIISDEKGSIIVFSLKKQIIESKYNFYKKKYKKIAKKLNIISDKNIIYVADNIGYLYAFDYNKQKIIWAKNYKVSFLSNLKILNGKLIVSDHNNILYFFNKRNGEILKYLPTEETIIKNQFVNNLSITDDENLLFLNSYGSLYLLDSNLLQVSWFRNLNQSNDLGSSNLFFGSEVINMGNIILVSSNNKTFLIEKATGVIIKQFNFSSISTPIINNDYIFLISKNNLLICIDIRTKKIIYSADIDNQIANYLNLKKKKSFIKNFMLINSEIVIFLENSYVIYFKPDGVIKFVKKLPSVANSFPIVVNQRIHFIDKKNKIIVLN